MRIRTFAPRAVRIGRLASVGLMAVLLGGCGVYQSTKHLMIDPPGPLGPEKGGLAVHLQLRNSLFGDIRPNAAFFVKLEETPVMVKAETFYATNYEGDDWLYSLNLDPGQYMLVMASPDFRNRGEPPEFYMFPFGQAVILNENAAVGTLAEVQAGQLSDMGTFVVSEDKDWTDADPLQNHLYELIKPSAFVQVFGLLYYDPNTTRFTGAMLEKQSDGSDEAEMLAAAQEDLKGSGWDVIARHKAEAKRGTDGAERAAQ